MRLLIVDDEYFAIRGIMDGVNWEVLQFDEILQAGSYGQAVELLERQPVEILLCARSYMTLLGRWLAPFSQ